MMQTLRHPYDSAIRAAGGRAAPMSEVVRSVKDMMIDCDDCTERGPACGDCVVSFLTIERRPGAFEVDNDQAAAMSALAGGGLVPPLRLVRSDERAS